MNKNMMNNIGLLGIIVLMITMLIACDSESGGGETPPVGISNLYAWGQNNNGQLGNGNTISQNTPVPVGTKTWTQVSVGFSHTMAIDSTDHLYAWGWNNNGQLGNGNKTDQTTPVAVEPSKTWKLVSAGSGHSIAIDNADHLFAWGANEEGQLGNGNKTDQTTPVKIGTKTWKLVSTGNGYSMAIDTDNYLYAWGWNNNGQLGNGNKTDQTTPVAIEPSKTWKLVSTGDSLDKFGSVVVYTMAIDNLGNLFAWGANSYGQLGIGTDTDGEGNEVLVGKETPFKVGTKTWKLVSAGYSHSKAIDSDGHLFAWGANEEGQLGNGNTTQQNTPIAIEETKTWIQVSMGIAHTMAIDTDYHLFALGRNDSGQLGNGSGNGSTALIQIGTQTWTQVSVGRKHTLGIIQESVSGTP